MKRILVALVLSAMVATVAPAPATAATTAPSRRETRQLCLSFFAADRCDAVAAEWHALVTQQTPGVTVRALARKIVRGQKDLPCEAIFSDQVCDTIGRVGDIVGNPGGTVLGLAGTVLAIVRETGDEVVPLLVCTVNQTCVPGFAGSDGPCEEVFSEAVCDAIGQPGWVIEYVWSIVRCYIDPACTPISINCGDILCDRGYRRSYGF